MEDKFIKSLLEEYTNRINVPDFVKDDPVQFPRRFSRTEDIEAVSVLVSHISWGKRSMILRDSERLLGILGDSPAEYIREGDFSNVKPEGNIHRTFFGRDLIYFMNGLGRIFRDYGSLQNFAAQEAGAGEEFSWRLADSINRITADANSGCCPSNRCLPGNLRTTALKRLNMALRWLVRNDGIVDMGVWDVVSPADLYIPLDVHVGNIGRQLGLISRKQDDRRTVLDLTATLRKFDPADPVKYDFALFGIGVEGLLKGDR